VPAGTVPDIAFAELAGGVPDWLVAAKMGTLGALALAAAVWRPVENAASDCWTSG
jgi:hypothetical protein